MSDDDLRKDMRAMRDQLAEASAARKQTKADAPSAAPPASPDTSDSSESAEEVASLQREVDRLLENLDKELSEIPTATAIGIFALGVLLGRFLPR